MRLRRTLVTTTLAMALASPVLLQSAEPLVEPLNPGLVETLGNGFFVAPPMEASLVVTNVRVFNDDNELVLSERTLADSVQLLAADLPDGTYRYEVVSVFELTESSGSGANREEFSSQRQFGSFEVRAGAIIFRAGEQSREQSRRDDLSMLDRMTDKAMAAAGWVLSLVVSEAQAQNLIASAGPAFVYWDDTADAGTDFAMVGDSVFGDLRILDQLSSNSHTIVDINGSPGSSLTASSIVIDSDGDIHWAGSGMNFDRGVSALSIGTTDTGGVDLNIHDTNPDIQLFNESFNDSFVLEYDGFFFNTSYHSGALSRTITSVHFSAPAQSFVIDSLGNADFGGKIHVGAQNDPVGQFTITSPDQPRFEMNDTTTGKRWRFSVASDKFAINNLDVAGTEFQVFDNGDALLTGALTQNSDRDAKQDIVPVDRHDVLAKIAGLPIAEWSYKDNANQRHIGPMAQDFYAAFGLGRNEKGISTLDSSGVALAGIQALAEENTRLSQENRALKERLDWLESQQLRLQEVVLQMHDEQRARQVLTSTVLN